MAKIETKLHNLTEIEIELKAGNHAIFRTIARIKPKGTYVVSSNANETYKEYWCAMQASKEKIILSSDDCMDWKEIAIKANDDDPSKFWWKGTVSRDSTSQTADAGAEPPGGFLASARRFIGKIFSPNKSHTSSGTHV